MITVPRYESSFSHCQLEPFVTRPSLPVHLSLHLPIVSSNRGHPVHQPTLPTSSQSLSPAVPQPRPVTVRTPKALLGPPQYRRFYRSENLYKADHTDVTRAGPLHSGIMGYVTL